MKAASRRIAERWAVALPLAIRPQLLVGFGVGILAFVVLSVVSYRSQMQFAETTGWVRHTHEVLARIQKVNSDLITVQSAVGGFVISGRQDFLAPYYDARRELEDDERALRRLTADNPRQQRRLTTLEELIRQRLAYSEETSIFSARRFRGGGRFDSNRPRTEIMKKFAAVIADLENEERDLLTGREAQARAQTARTFFILSIGTFVALTLLLTVLFFLNSEATDRREAEATSRLSAEVVKSTGDAVITITLGGIVTSWNPGAELIFGYTAEEAVGRPVLMFVPPECAGEEAEILAKIERGERVTISKRCERTRMAAA